MEPTFGIDAHQIALAIDRVSREPGIVAYAMPRQTRLTLTADAYCDTFDHRPALAPMAMASTTREQYEAGLIPEIEALRRGQGSKTVYSRLIAGYAAGDLSETISRYFEMCPDTFRFIFAQPCDGTLWFGASPELLVDNRPAEHRLYTCALAGSRPSATDASTPWDAKNLAEHRMVVEFVDDTLSAFGLNPVNAPTAELRFGPVTHLRTAIEADAAPDCRKLLAKLSPTPALAGLPRDNAVEHIRVIEQHARGYYGGYVAVNLGGGRTVAYVNLRSARVQLCNGGFRYNIIVGGGITPDSVPEAEWNETVLKSDMLLRAVNLFSENTISVI